MKNATDIIDKLAGSSDKIRDVGMELFKGNCATDGDAKRSLSMKFIQA